MTRAYRILTLTTAGALMSVAALAGPPGSTALAGRTGTTQCPWLNQSLPVAVRVGEVLGQMTLDEKMGMLGLASTSDGYENATTAVPALCVPRLILQDGPAGITAGPPGSHTQLPAPIDVGASFDPSLAYQYGQVQGGEAAAKGIDAVQGPDVNLARVPQGGRDDEGYGEDPYLAGQLGVADARGIESQGEMAMVKHLDDYNQEDGRNTTADNEIVSGQALHELYLPAFQDVVQQAHVASVMCSYAVINGVFSCENPLLLTDVLRDQWGFQGFVRSDLGAVHDPVAAFGAGIDQVKPAAGGAVEAAVSDGQISMATVNAAVASVLTAMFSYSVFNTTPAGTATTDAATPADVADARDIAEQGTVLLQNTGQILPLSNASGSSIAVIGTDGGSGADTAMTSGSSAYVSAASVVTPYQGIQAAAGPGVSVTYNDGSSLTSAAATAAAAKVAVVFVSDPAGEGADLSNLSLPGDQDQLIEAVAAANPDTVVVINSGNPVLMPWLSQVKGVLEAWYPGQQDGAAIAALLFGSADPSGKLPVTFPQSASQTPVSSPQQYPGENGQIDYSEGLDMGYRGYDAENITPLFPFGYGLSYTTFGFSDLSVTPGATTALGSVRVAATVTNTGSVAGADVAQLYVGDPAAAGEPPRLLKGFQKVTLAPGQSARVQFTLTPADLSVWDSTAPDSTAQAWQVPDGQFQVYVGDSSALAGLPLQGSFQVTGTTGTRGATISAPGQAEAGQPFTVTAALTSGGGNLTVHGARLALSAPAGWQVTPAGPVTAPVLGPSQALTATWGVTAPAGAQDNVSQLAVTAAFQSPGGSATSSAYAQVTVAPLVTTTVSPASVITQAGQAANLTVTNTDTSGYPVSLSWAATPPAGSGITVGPGSGAAALAPGASASAQIAVTAAAPGASLLPVTTSVTAGGLTQPGAGAYPQVTVPYPSTAAAFDNTGITDDSDHSPGDFDGYGNSYSAEALADAGITPGGQVTSDGVSFTWPSVAAGQPDNVVASGQTIAVPGSGSTLGFLGAADNDTASGTGSITYADGSTQSFTIGFQNWIDTSPTSGDTLVATTSYFNRTTSGPARTPSVFAAFVPLQPGKTVAYVTLPDVSGPTVSTSTTSMHIFALGFG